MKKIIFVLIMLGIILSCEVPKYIEPDNATGHYKKICLEGHLYYEGFAYNRGYLAIKLNDDGKPIKCGEKTK